jgi:hypothetical protein
MGSKSDALELSLQNHVLGATAYVAPATVYLALYSAVPSDAGGGTELTSGTAPGYARVAITNNTSNFPAATTNGTTGKGEKKLGVAQSTPANSSGVNWPTVVGWALLDTSTGGTQLMWGEVAPLAVTPAATFTVPANTIVWRED